MKKEHNRYTEERTRFNTLRRLSGMTQQQFADYFGIKKRTIECWDEGIHRCPDYLLELLRFKLWKDGILK